MKNTKTNMELEIQKNSNNLPEDINEIIKSILEDFCNELDLYRKNTKDDEVFMFNEQTYVGFLNNAIVRKNVDQNIITLQEYCLKNKETQKNGRPDLLMFDTIKNLCVLFEAKHNYTNESRDNNWSENDSIKYLNKVIEQAERYYEADQDFYRGKKTYLCAIIFDSTKITSKLDNYLKTDELKKIKNYYSYTLSSKDLSNNVLNVYGVIKAL